MSDLHAHTVAYVQETALPHEPPPIGEAGFIGWVRKNLFATITDTLLTFLSLAFVIYLIYEFAPWFINSTWDADSLSECREKNTGACFAVVVNRWNQLMFGFYPEVERWRPILAFVLMGAALVPLLWDGPARKFLWFTLLYPLVAWFLIWGGPIWMVIAILVGPIVGYLVSAGLRSLTGGPLAAAAGVLAAIIWWMFLAATLSDILTSIFGFVGLPPIQSDQLGGVLLALIIGVTGIAFSFPIGILLALGRQSPMPAVKMLCVGFIEFIRGVPLITLLFVASVLLNYFLPKGTVFDLVLRVVIMVTLFASAYMAEVIRGGLAALPRGQTEAAQSLGLPYWDSMRLIILPQALKVSIPGIVSTFIGLFKDTTLVSIIGLLDPIGIMNPIRADSAWNGIIWELLIFVAVFFFIFCFSMSRYSMYVERKLDTGHRS